MEFFKDDKEMFDPASVKMQEIIVREGKKDDPKMTVLLEEAVNSYTKTYMAGNQALGRNLDANAMRNHFYRFPGVDNDKDKTLSAMLRMAVIAQTQERYEKTPVETDEQRAEKAALEGLVKQLFVELKRDFKPSDLPPYTLVKLGMHLAGTSQPEESIAYFDEILDPSEPDPVRKKARINGMSKYRKNAVFGKAVALGRSKDNAKVDTAIKMMRDELSKEESSSNPDRKAMEDAQYNLVKFTFARQDWPAVIAAADKYRENKTYKKNLPEVLYLQGEAYLKQNELDKALINFMNITGTYKGLVKWSAPAVLAQMDTLWKRNTMSQGAGKQPSDRYVAWKAGSQYVQLLDTPANRKKMTAEDSALVNEVKDKTAKFGSDPAVSQERRTLPPMKQPYAPPRARNNNKRFSNQSYESTFSNNGIGRTVLPGSVHGPECPECPAPARQSCRTDHQEWPSDGYLHSFRQWTHGPVCGEQGIPGSPSADGQRLQDAVYF